MSKIYVVKSSSGSYDTYFCHNEKAFINKSDAEKYARDLDNEHYFKPHFVTDEFEAIYNECEDLLPEWGDSPISPSVDINAYKEWINKCCEEDIEKMCNLMYERGWYLSKEMYHQYNRWKDYQSDEYYDCEIEEIELV